LIPKSCLNNVNFCPFEEKNKIKNISKGDNIIRKALEKDDKIRDLLAGDDNIEELRIEKIRASNVFKIDEKMEDNLEICSSKNQKSLFNWFWE
jgi:hypothetical protein